ncbi:homoserine kinase [Alkalihalobacillus alcalophilus ATCC 27647 = CGMCC 1.3604]|uniref:Serine kinase n=1 Tax=Alkalihalobacillus alcalophilus ATCC 27647 = CGMCC 1.3604 TaxID=1218173 RepID=A0A094WI86_ALKAL|nr:phosphotransferase [Alkalihalobacillus alcalophilus]KGA96536.1 serine kinase [Alkalihalobacillus alcalophilus ATCC 27647 = CGMCC 1.3604]MED1564157.1 phosphotransferase [Alkalihalobacillus alcalophilus]THG91833.1 homoserine kinase [Alkalihalobacillus alcalophilus ATCC 27647 = CGMCC 1.3604]
MDGKEILKKFLIDVKEEPQSIYSFSPVYKVDEQIIKRTQSPLEKSKRLIRYTTYLNEHEIPVVIPVSLKVDNPQQIQDDCYVVYPFIYGNKYTGSEKNIRQAGELLGKIHSLSPETNSYQLPQYRVFDFYKHEVEESIGLIRHFTKQYQANVDTESLYEQLLESVHSQEAIKAANIQWLLTPHDYKANNLIYQKQPILIDPDNAIWLPKLFDLALALFLFHNELDSAPNRVFTKEEWQWFLAGYYTYSSIKEEEKEWWLAALNHVFLDEVMWLLAEVEEDWKRPEQRQLFESVVELILNPTDYQI